MVGEASRSVSVGMSSRTSLPTWESVPQIQASTVSTMTGRIRPKTAAGDTKRATEKQAASFQISRQKYERAIQALEHLRDHGLGDALERNLTGGLVEAEISPRKARAKRQGPKHGNDEP